VICGLVAYALALDGILLVREFEVGMRDAAQNVLIIQRGLESGVDCAVNREMDMSEEKGLGTGFL